jgi:hypothetical protein
MKYFPHVIALLAIAAGSMFAQEKSALETDPSGWTDIMPDASFTGWTRLAIPPTAGLQEPNQWRVDTANKVLECSGAGGHDMLRYDKLYGNFIFHVEWKATPKTPDEKRYNGGIMVRTSKYGEIWFQAQTTPGGGYLFGDTIIDGKAQRVNASKQMKENRTAPMGEWNTFEVRGEGDTITLWVNGAVVNTLSGVVLREGYIGLEAEGYPATYRNVKVKSLN